MLGYISNKGTKSHTEITRQGEPWTVSSEKNAVEQAYHLMDAERCQNHGPVRLWVPLLEFGVWHAPWNQASLR